MHKKGEISDLDTPGRGPTSSSGVVSKRIYSPNDSLQSSSRRSPNPTRACDYLQGRYVPGMVEYRAVLRSSYRTTSLDGYPIRIWMDEDSVTCYPCRRVSTNSRAVRNDPHRWPTGLEVCLKFGGRDSWTEMVQHSLVLRLGSLANPGPRSQEYGDKTRGRFNVTSTGVCLASRAWILATTASPARTDPHWLPSLKGLACLKSHTNARCGRVFHHKTWPNSKKDQFEFSCTKRTIFSNIDLIFEFQIHHLAIARTRTLHFGNSTNNEDRSRSDWYITLN